MQQNDFNRMQAEAILSAREMHTRASPPKNNDMNTGGQDISGQAAFGNSYYNQQTYFKKEIYPPPENFNGINFSGAAVPESCRQNSRSGKSPFSSIFGSINNLLGFGMGSGGNNDFLLVFMLIILLSSDGGDKMLMLALFYIMA